jgi:hypothetical protein
MEIEKLVIIKKEIAELGLRLSIGNEITRDVKRVTSKFVDDKEEIYYDDGSDEPIYIMTFE